jgi:ribonuclease HI
MQIFNIKPRILESIPTTGRNPATAHKHPFKIDIADNKEDSITADTEGRESVKIYSDGSAQEGKVGAAAVLIRPGKETHKLHYHLGTTEQHTVFEAELVGLLLGLHLIKTEKSRTSYALGVDNQAVLSAVATPGNRSGHYLADMFLNAAFNIRKTNGTANYSLMLRWMAGHVNIEGNETADKEAKLAAEGTSSTKLLLPKTLRKPLKHNKSAANQTHKSELKTAWFRGWHSSPQARRLNHIDVSLPSPKFLKLTSDVSISRKGASWLFQLRTGHFPLNTYLHRFKCMESASCPVCGYYDKTPQHYLLDCPAYAHERWLLLAGKSAKNRDFAIIVGKAKNTKPIIDYIQATGRFMQMHDGNSRGDREAGSRHIEARTQTGRGE